MAASYFLSNPSSDVIASAKAKRLLSEKISLLVISRLFISFITIFLCLSLVPESPQQLASICQKHHSAMACQVW